ncbi:hypothetical protein HYX12_02705 [Candidatus Woesearchaeota archaeon]|nr:hypothetical protein [Candidatus Woesearchaeota archaeon]
MIQTITKTAITGKVTGRYNTPQYHKTRQHRKNTSENIPPKRELPAELRGSVDSLIGVAYGDLDPRRWSNSNYRHTPFQFLASGEKVEAQDVLDYIIDSHVGSTMAPWLYGGEPGFVLYVLPFQKEMLEFESLFRTEREPGLQAKLCLGKSPIAIFSRENNISTRYLDETRSQNVSDMEFADGKVCKVSESDSKEWQNGNREYWVRNDLVGLVGNNLLTGVSSKCLYDPEVVLRAYNPGLADLEFQRKSTPKC